VNNKGIQIIFYALSALLLISASILFGIGLVFHYEVVLSKSEFEAFTQQLSVRSYYEACIDSVKADRLSEFQLTQKFQECATSAKATSAKILEFLEETSPEEPSEENIKNNNIHEIENRTPSPHGHPREQVASYYEI